MRLGGKISTLGYADDLNYLGINKMDPIRNEKTLVEEG